MDDLISRTEAIDDLHGKDPSQIWDTADIEVWVNALPSAQPERMRGRWMPIMHLDVLDGYQCSTCKAWSRFKFNFCRNCGTDMREDSND